jgi:ADP-ribose pyrophosphatase YjhB (NUDIX family)
MYKVFVNDKLIIITSSLNKENNFPVYQFKNIVLDEVLHKLKNSSTKGIVLYSSDLEKDWHSFLTNIAVIPAAGGLVLNPKNEVLFIFRNNYWDLPKGKIEKGEGIETAAIREVEEECSIFNLKILKKLIITYHIYFEKGIKLKLTHWFLMESDFDKELVPQLEEGITAVSFKNETQIKDALNNSFENIKLVYNAFKEG